MTGLSRTFAAPPSPIEWAFLPLVGYGLFVFEDTSGWSKVLALLCLLVVANGWISTRASSEFYSDLLFFLDIVLLSLYFLMIDTLRRGDDTVRPAFWWYSFGVFVAYALWDVAIMPLSDQGRRRRFALYIAVLTAALPVQAAVALVVPHHGVVQVAGIATWLAVLSLWHYDKWRASHPR